MGATEDGEKELIAIHDGHRESEQSWKELLLDCKARGLTIYDSPAEHWIHLRTTNPIESTFATARLRHRRAKRNGSRTACLAMVFKLVQAAEKKWRLLNGSKLIPAVIQGVRFIAGTCLTIRSGRTDEVD